MLFLRIVWFEKVLTAFSTLLIGQSINIITRNTKCDANVQNCYPTIAMTIIVYKENQLVYNSLNWTKLIWNVNSVVVIYTGTPPSVVLPPSGYWVDGIDDASPDGEDAEPRPQPGTPRPSTKRHNIDTDDTAKYYRRFFLGMVILTFLFLSKS